MLVAEGYRIAPVRLRAGHRSYLTSVIGLPFDSELRRPHDAALRPIDVPPDGVTLTRRLAERLGVAAGDIVTIEVMEGRRRKIDLPVSAIVDEVIGMSVVHGDRYAQPAYRRRRGRFGRGAVRRAVGARRRCRGDSRSCPSSSRCR